MLGFRKFLILCPEKGILSAELSLPRPEKGRLAFNRLGRSIEVEKLLPVLANFVTAWHLVQNFDDRLTHGLDHGEGGISFPDHY